MRAVRLAFVASTFVAATLTAGCNSLFGIHEGKPRPICADVDPQEPLIDDMEDGDGFICASNGRNGRWYTVGDGTSTDLTPGLPDPTLIPGGPRGTSRYAARLTGSGFTDWGAILGFVLNIQGLAAQPYDASTAGGIKFWMKSNAPVRVMFLTPETMLPANGGRCTDSATATNCNNAFSFEITAPGTDWTEYTVPFVALSQRGGSATWNPRFLTNIEFKVPPGPAFDVWVDDVRFYFCSTSRCLPTCTDPVLPVACPESSRDPAACRPPGTDCALVATWCSDPAMIDDMEDGEAAICDSDGREGWWYVVGDPTSTEIQPKPNTPFFPAAIPEGRGASRYAARVTGSGFVDWGALMGFALNAYDASAATGITFWMKTDVPVFVNVRIPETVPRSDGGRCSDGATALNCYNHFEYEIAAPSSEWKEYNLPFEALRQSSTGGDTQGNLIAGSATWDPSDLRGIEFGTHAPAFDFWVDDIRFYTCEGDTCVPTCTADAPVACPASGGRPAGCWPDGTDCSASPDVASNLGVWGSGPGDVWVVGFSAITHAGTILHWDGLAWSPTTSGTFPPIWSVWGNGASDVWAVADHGTILRWNGLAWSTTTTGANASFNAVWGSGANDVWAVTYPGTMLHFDGSAWSAATTGSARPLWALWGSGPSDIWAVGAQGTILHGDGSIWSASTSGTNALLSVWGSGPSDVWAVGVNGTIVHWDGSAWSAVASGTTRTLGGVGGSGPSDVWAVGASGTIVHWDGSAWSAVASGTNRNLSSVWGSGPNDVWATGSGTILHWDGSSWAAQR